MSNCQKERPVCCVPTARWILPQLKAQFHNAYVCWRKSCPEVKQPGVEREHFISSREADQEGF